jgi:AcrR family transcriptional regulator
MPALRICSPARPGVHPAGVSGRGAARERLLDAVPEVAASDGYADLTVERLLAVAGVSRASFYQYFTNLDDCFWSAYRRHAEQLVREVSRAAAGSRRRELAVLEALAAFATSRPQTACLLMREGLAGGPMGLSERDALIAAVARTMTVSGGQGSGIDLPAPTLVGAMFRFVSMRLADIGGLDGLRDELLEWAGAFARGASQPSWSARFAPVLPGRSSRAPVHGHRLRPGGTPRERILRATAATLADKHCRAVTVADIVAAAGVSRRLFYNEFSSRSDAFVAASEHGFQQLLAACTPAFFSSGTWPERVWQSALAFTGFFAREPSLAQLGFVECYALGRDFAPRAHDMQLAFTLFLEDGYRQRPEARSLSRSCGVLTAAAIFELGFEACRPGPSGYIRPMQPLAVYILLTPFIGSGAAGTFVAGKLSAQTAAAPAAVCGNGA